MTDLLANDFPDTLDTCIERFWNDNPELKKQVLRDWYNGGYVTAASNLAGLKAVSKWLSAGPVPNG